MRPLKFQLRLAWSVFNICKTNREKEKRKEKRKVYMNFYMGFYLICTSTALERPSHLHVVAMLIPR